MDIQINQTFAKIGIQTSPGRLDVRTQAAELQLYHVDSTVSVHNEFPHVEISNRECFNTSGLKDLETFMRDAVQFGYKTVSSYISKTAADGEAYAAIENNTNPLPSIVIRDAYPVHNFGIDYIPKAKPQISVKGEAKIDVNNSVQGANNGVEGTYTPASVRLDIAPSNVRIYMIQNSSVDIKYVGKNVDVYK